MTNSIKFLSSSKQHKWIKSNAGVGFKEDLKDSLIRLKVQSFTNNSLFYKQHIRWPTRSNSNGTTSLCKSQVDGEVMGLRATKCMSNLPIKKQNISQVN